MNNRNLVSTAGLAVVAVAIAITLPGGSSAAAQRAKPGPTPTPSATPTIPPPPAVEGCYDIIGGGPTYQKFVASYTPIEEPVIGALPESPPLGETPTTGVFTAEGIVLSDRGSVYGPVTVADNTCLDVTYVLEVYDNSTSALIARDARKGDGTSGAVDLATVFLNGDLDVTAQALTIDAFGRVIDRGSVSGPLTVTADADGTPPDGGGGQQFWG